MDEKIRHRQVSIGEALRRLHDSIDHLVAVCVATMNDPGKPLAEMRRVYHDCEAVMEALEPHLEGD